MKIVILYGSPRKGDTYEIVDKVKSQLNVLSSRDVRSMTMSFQISNDTLEKYTGNENEVIVPENVRRI